MSDPFANGFIDELQKQAGKNLNPLAIPALRRHLAHLGSVGLKLGVFGTASLVGYKTWKSLHTMLDEMVSYPIGG